MPRCFTPLFHNALNSCWPCPTNFLRPALNMSERAWPIESPNQRVKIASGNNLPRGPRRRLASLERSTSSSASASTLTKNPKATCFHQNGSASSLCPVGSNNSRLQPSSTPFSGRPMEPTAGTKQKGHDQTRDPVKQTSLS